LTGESDSKSKRADDGEACASNQQKINGEYKTAQAIQHGTSTTFNFKQWCLPCGSQQSVKKRALKPWGKCWPKKECQTLVLG
jgi:hypothetical protein